MTPEWVLQTAVAQSTLGNGIPARKPEGFMSSELEPSIEFLHYWRQFNHFLINFIYFPQKLTLAHTQTSNLSSFSQLEIFTKLEVDWPEAFNARRKGYRKGNERCVKGDIYLILTFVISFRFAIVFTVEECFFKRMKIEVASVLCTYKKRLLTSPITTTRRSKRRWWKISVF